MCKTQNLALSEIGSAVEQFTKILAGSNQGVVDKTISLTVYKQNSPDLTLIDLPGITRNPVGDQPSNIEDQIKNMINRYIFKMQLLKLVFDSYVKLLSQNLLFFIYITSETSIILSVVPANIDFPTSEALKMAHIVDPAGKLLLLDVTCFCTAALVCKLIIFQMRGP